MLLYKHLVLLSTTTHVLEEYFCGQGVLSPTRGLLHTHSHNLSHTNTSVQAVALQLIMTGQGACSLGGRLLLFWWTTVAGQAKWTNEKGKREGEWEVSEWQGEMTIKRIFFFFFFFLFLPRGLKLFKRTSIYMYALFALTAKQSGLWDGGGEIGVGGRRMGGVCVYL